MVPTGRHFQRRNTSTLPFRQR
uniref:Uncharacterized protein n=1 Tax=Rhizophora mucronata TaxID=61149 RepID=A0A2P2NI91_RHIMU